MKEFMRKATYIPGSLQLQRFVYDSEEDERLHAYREIHHCSLQVREGTQGTGTRGWWRHVCVIVGVGDVYEELIESVLCILRLPFYRPFCFLLAPLENWLVITFLATGRQCSD